jgi:hypothetical protein
MSFQDELIARALEQWERFGRDEGREDKFIDADGNTTKSEKSNGVPNRRKETVEPFASRVANYWLTIPSKQYDDLVKKFAKAKGRLDGTIDLAWSAAFISYCMQMAGAGSNFPYSSGHATWMVLSIKNKRNGKLKAALVGFKPGEIPLQPGDLIARPREAGTLTIMRWRKAGSSAIRISWWRSTPRTRLPMWSAAMSGSRSARRR